MTKHEEIKLISELYSLEEMFDERTMEMFRILQGIEADMTIEGLTKYINRYLLKHTGLHMSHSTQG